jgi:hypothetical protein
VRTGTVTVRSMCGVVVRLFMTHPFLDPAANSAAVEPRTNLGFLKEDAARVNPNERHPGLADSLPCAGYVAVAEQSEHYFRCDELCAI